MTKLQKLGQPTDNLRTNKISKNERTDLAGAGGMSKELEAFYDETIKSPVKITFKNYTSVL